METKTEKKNISKIHSGKIVSSKMKDTVVVLVERYTKHPKYGKFLRKWKRIKAHDALNKHQVGEVVEIVEVKPLSKDKSFVILEK